MNQNINQRKPYRIAFIQSSWHEAIVKKGKEGFLEKFKEFGLSTKLVDFYQLPGALEIPLKCKQVCETNKYDLVIAAGFIVDGGIYRHDFVASAVLDGIMNVQLELGIPILSMVLTPHDFDDSKARNDFFQKHFIIKGQEIADAAHALLTVN
ncbi:MAG: riboflavin synthase subunit beta [SAR86 cluster bacterium]|uniref:6,7-dimethyl-8-ribityllumazine synthase n=1 Tax=SAR86 cluster bacterium TaxID=2030880 RepID=A0A2A5CHV7_9GAMM|nr:6,7-dimethyl-8-ribityllumazine synthase [Gammaproteobacteria bacterium AH-315-E17]PCJ43467.1 MAG: riboflavin synthase subunit beta [SAR86 cluster bacterium]